MIYLEAMCLVLALFPANILRIPAATTPLDIFKSLTYNRKS